MNNLKKIITGLAVLMSLAACGPNNNGEYVEYIDEVPVGWTYEETLEMCLEAGGTEVRWVESWERWVCVGAFLPMGGGQ